MRKSVRSKAEAEFASIRQQDKKALKEKQKVEQEKADHVAHLRSLRLAKEAADKEAAAIAARDQPLKKRKTAAQPAPAVADPVADLPK